MSGGATYASFTYDAAGNMTAKCTGGAVATCTGAGLEKLDYVYDGKDQLRRVTRRLSNSVTGSEEYWYDGNGSRVAIVKKDAAGTKTEMVWFIGDTQAHYGGTGTVTHVYSNVSLGTPVARIDRTADTTTATEYQFHGLASSTLATVASTGTVNTSFRYTPWGAVMEATNTGGSSGSAAHRRRHNDKYVDELTSLSYYGARYYDSTLIGWTQSDPLYRFAPDAAAAQPRNALLYAFSNNNPIRYIDPDGRSVAATMAAGAEAGSVAGPFGAVAGAIVGAAIGYIGGTALLDAISDVEAVPAETFHDMYNDGSLYDLGVSINALSETPSAAPTLDLGRTATSEEVSIASRTSDGATSTHGNSKSSNKENHTYDIERVKAGKGYETGIVKNGTSSAELNTNGSPRANSQANKWNKEEKKLGNEYKAHVTKKGIKATKTKTARQRALDREQRETNKHHKNGEPLDKHSRPQPTVKQ